MKSLKIILLLILMPFLGNAQFENLIPISTATHIAVKDGAWSNPSTWDSNTVPDDGAIVIIPKDKSVIYDVYSEKHIFAVRVDGDFTIYRPNTYRKLVVDTFLGSSDSFIRIIANQQENSNVEILLKPFDILQKKRNPNVGTRWNSTALNYYNDGLRVKDHFGANLPSDGPGVLGRYSWDPRQVTLSFMSAGKVRIKGKGKLDFSELSKNIPKGATSISLKDAPTNWEIGDQILLAGTKNQAESEIMTITSINGNDITLNTKTRFTHQGINLDGNNYYTYAGNLTRNIIIRSDYTKTQEFPTRRGHVMFMFNGDVKVKNAQFKDLGRTDKSNMLDDLKIGIPKIITTNGSQDIALPNFKNELETNPSLIENQRGRYALHFHKSLRGKNSSQKILAEGNVVWGSPGWGMVHHDSHADFSDNIVLDIEGGAMVAESGSETGIWRHNFVTGEKKDNTVPFLNNNVLSAPLKRKLREIIDDDFKMNEGYCLQGRAVEMIDNVAGAIQIGFNYQGNGDHIIVADELDTSIFEASGMVNPFPFDDTINRTFVPFINFRNNIVFNAIQTFKSQTRNKTGAFHRVNSVIDNLVGWNISQFGIYISSNYGYLINNSKFHSIDSRNKNNTAALIHIGNDNITFNNSTFYNWRNTGVQVTQKNGQISSNKNSQFIFNKVTWKGSPSNFKPYRSDPNKNLKVTDINVNPNFKVTFSKASDMDDVIDLDKKDYKFTVKGKVFDQIGVSSFGNYSPDKETKNLTRHYRFGSRDEIINRLLSKQKFYTDSRGKYFLFEEYISNRISTAPPTGVKIRIYVKGYNDTKSSENNALVDYDLMDTDVLYPNPAQSFITIKTAGNKPLGKVNIFDIYGKKIYENEYQETGTSIDVRQLPTGTYLLKSLTMTKTFVIQ